MDNLKRLLQLNMTENIGVDRLKILLEYFKDIDKIFSASYKELIKIEGINERVAKSIHNLSEKRLKKELELIKKYNIDIISIENRDYPENLSNIYSPPILLYLKGNLLKKDINAVAIVGSRKATYYGLSTAEDLAYKLASRGITVVSGMARGIDTAAHKGAIKAGGRTVAVLGSGLGNIYPPENKELSEKISKSGCLISEFPIQTLPNRQNFPKRNRIISGLSLGVVVVEAAKRSGSLITANFALEQGREVFAVPGKVKSGTSEGTHDLIKQGAKLVSNVDDIIDELNLELYSKRNFSYIENNICLDFLNKHEKKVFSYISEEPIHLDKLIEKTYFSLNEILNILVKLQNRQLVKELPGKKFLKKI